MITKTETKLDEARFFLTALESNYAKYPEVKYFLSALISAARSVLWVMRAEYSGIPEWEEWFAGIVESPEETRLLRGTTALRNRTVKKGGSLTGWHAEFLFSREEFTPEIQKYLEARGPGASITVTATPRADSGLDSRMEPTVSDSGFATSCRVGEVYFVVEEFPDDNVLEVFRQYVAWLEPIVAECTYRFAQDGAPNKSSRPE